MVILYLWSTSRDQGSWIDLIWIQSKSSIENILLIKKKKLVVDFYRSRSNIYQFDFPESPGKVSQIIMHSHKKSETAKQLIITTNVASFIRVGWDKTSFRDNTVHQKQILSSQNTSNTRQFWSRKGKKCKEASEFPLTRCYFLLHYR